MQARIIACIYTAKAIAGEDTRKLRDLIPLLLRHNDLPAIQVPLQAFFIVGRPPFNRQQKKKKQTRHNVHQPAAETTKIQPLSEESSASSADSTDDEDDELRAQAVRGRANTPRHRCAAHKDDVTPENIAEEDKKSANSTLNTCIAVRPRPSLSQTTAENERGDARHSPPQTSPPQEDNDG